MPLEGREIEVPAKTKIESQLASHLPVILYVRRIVMLYGGGQDVVLGAVVAAARKDAEQEGGQRIPAERVRSVVSLLREGFCRLKTERVADTHVVVHNQAKIHARVYRVS